VLDNTSDAAIIYSKPLSRSPLGMNTQIRKPPLPLDQWFSSSAATVITWAVLAATDAWVPSQDVICKEVWALWSIFRTIHKYKRSLWHLS
jgi:hypothetical protein